MDCAARRGVKQLAQGWCQQAPFGVLTGRLQDLAEGLAGPAAAGQLGVQRCKPAAERAALAAPEAAGLPEQPLLQERVLQQRGTVGRAGGRHWTSKTLYENTV
jgi:hypothetical protein